MEVYGRRLEAFKGLMAGKADLAFFPVSADLQYLTGIPRAMPHYGAIRHPGDWMEGLWVVPDQPALIVLSRMSAELGGLQGPEWGETRILADEADPDRLLEDLLGRWSLPPDPRLALGDRARAETLIHLQAHLPGAAFLSGSELLHPLRRVKSEAEIGLMRIAGEITEASFAGVLSNLRHGMTELEVLTEVDYQLQRSGSLGPSFVSALYCSGPEHPLLFGQPQITNPRRLEPPVALLFDFGAIHQGYCYDFGRTVYFGEPARESLAVFEAVMRAQERGIEALTVGARAEEVDRAARRVIVSAGYGAEFRHRLGHGIGLDVHESPFLTEGDRTPLEEGMLFTVEPSITLERGLSARVEDVVRVGESAGQPLTQGFRELMVIE